MARITPKTNWVASDVPAATDFNRIENNSEQAFDELDAEVAARIADVDAEEAARIAGDNAEAAARIAADNVLRNEISLLSVYGAVGSLTIAAHNSWTGTGRILADTTWSGDGLIRGNSTTLSSLNAGGGGTEISKSNNASLALTGIWRLLTSVYISAPSSTFPIGLFIRIS